MKKQAAQSLHDAWSGLLFWGA